jgi:two-component system response regulator AlgR
MKIMIVDDENLARMRLKALLNELGYTNIIEATNGHQAIKTAKINNPDTVLMDIGMPGMNGMEATDILTKFDNPPIVIFTTAYNDRALEAFEKQAIDYLLKPVRKDRLEQALTRASTLRKTFNCDNEEKKRTHINVNQNGGMRLIPINQIYYFRAEQKYVILCWQEGEALIDLSLRKIEDEFSEYFIRIHRNAVVGLAHITGMQKNNNGQNFVLLGRINKKLEISRRHLAGIKKLFYNC